MNNRRFREVPPVVLNWRQPTMDASDRPTDRDLLDAFAKATYTANRVKETSVWPDGMDDDAIKQATSNYAELLATQCLDRMRPPPVRGVPGRKPKEAGL